MMYGERKEVIERMGNRKKQREEFNKRGTHQASQRLKIIVDLGKEERDNDGVDGGFVATDGRKRERDQWKSDNFGQDDDDWNVYRDIQKDRFSEDEDDDCQALADVEEKIAELDVDFNLMLYQQGQGGHRPQCEEDY